VLGLAWFDRPIQAANAATDAAVTWPVWLMLACVECMRSTVTQVIALAVPVLQPSELGTAALTDGEQKAHQPVSVLQLLASASDTFKDAAAAAVDCATMALYG
jgi:hypothetical protein